MAEWARREVLKTGFLASMAALRFPALASSLHPLSPISTHRDHLSLDSNWRFHLGHADDISMDFGFGNEERGEFGKVGGFFDVSDPAFDLHDWRVVDLPHDWAVELPFEKADRLVAYGSKPLGREYPATSIGWYRRVFDIAESDLGRRLTIEFDGVFRDALVALNGHFLGRNLSGYAPFEVDITNVANYGGSNVLVLRVDATQNEGWFYEGAGIYRHVWLRKTHPVHVAHWGTFVTSELMSDHAVLTIRTEVENTKEEMTSCQVSSTIFGAAGRQVARQQSLPARIGPGERHHFTQLITITHPELWSIETPHLYQLATNVSVGGTPVDDYRTSFGIRSLRFNANEGFFLNGKRVELRGTCNHQDHAGLGVALPDRVQSYRIERLKAMGSNAYRTSHNPPTPELLDACDRLGMLVLDETRMFSSSDEGRSQLERLVRRDRNHPSVFCWSIANEEWAVQGNDTGTRIAHSLASLAHQLDPSRLITAGMDSRYTPGRGITLGVDVQGFNYQREDLDAFHRNFPARPAMGTETASAFSTRGIYARDDARGYISAYDVNRPDYGATAEQWWTFYAARRWLAGGFVWTGFDYRGEPSPFAWPCISSHFGIMDTCGFPKDTFFYYRAWWGDQPVLHLFPHWNWTGREGEEIEVWCHSNLERIELLLNGTSLGMRDIARNSHASWKVPYAPGTLTARGFLNGKVVLTETRETAGLPVTIVLEAERPSIDANGEDVGLIEVHVVDAEGRAVATADNVVSFEISGNGRLIGLGNGDPSSHEADKGTTRRLFNGLAQAIVQSSRDPGTLRIIASSPGLASATLALLCQSAPLRPSV
jgi:beta-galactosidase